MPDWMSPKVEVRPSPIEGKGLFCREAIAAGEVLCRQDPDGFVVMTDDEFHAYTKTVDSWNAVAVGGGLHRVDVRSREESPVEYGNHSCEPNARLAARTLVALRDIKPDEELTVDYAPLSERTWSMVCHCGSAACRGVVVGTQS
jgi:SET domain-containing protein